MKYHLLWVACTVGILQLSAVLCRSAHDKVTSTDNEKYPSTVAPSVAYTGQEFEHGTNSSNKLALDPGMDPNNYFYRPRIDWGYYGFIFLALIIIMFHSLACFFCCCYRKNVRKQGRIVRRHFASNAEENPNPQPPGTYNDVENYLLQNTRTWSYRLPQYHDTEDSLQLENIATEVQLPPYEDLKENPLLQNTSLDMQLPSYQEANESPLLQNRTTEIKPPPYQDTMVIKDKPQTVSPANPLPQPVSPANSLPQSVPPANSLPQPVSPANPSPQPVSPANPLPQQNQEIQHLSPRVHLPSTDQQSSSLVVEFENPVSGLVETEEPSSND